MIAHPCHLAARVVPGSVRLGGALALVSIFGRLSRATLTLRQATARDRARWAFRLIAVMGIAATATQASAQYRLQPGDAVEMTVAGLPELQNEAVVSVDGTITVPLAGALEAEGRTVREVADELRASLTQTVFRQRAGGSETLIVIDPAEVTLVVSRYRPVYVRGAVRVSGEQAFRPGMTIRQVLAVAGGVDPLQNQSGDPFSRAIELRAEYEALSVQAAELEARRRRIDSRLKRRDVLATRPDEDGPDAQAGAADRVSTEDGSAASAASQIEAERLAAAEQNLANEKAFLDRAIEQAERRAVVLRQQLAAEEQGQSADETELERIQGLFDRGLTPISRVTEARRQLLLSSTRVLETSSELAQVESNTIRLQRDLEEADERTQLDLLEELAEVNREHAQTMARLGGLAELLLHSGVLQSTALDAMQAAASVSVVRATDGTTERFAADEDTVLMPGDVVEVELSLPGQAETFAGRLAN